MRYKFRGHAYCIDYWPLFKCEGYDAPMRTHSAYSFSGVIS